MPDMLSAWTSDSPSSPRLTWYGSHSSRVELSGHVLATWVVKMTQALADLGEAGTGTRVLLDMPAHWRSLAWGLGVWTAGACVVLPARPDAPGVDAAPAPADGAPVDVVLTDHPGRWAEFAADGGVLLAQEMDDLALSWRGDHLRPGVVDAAAEVLGYPDRIDSVPIPLSSDPALVTGDGRTVAYAGLATWASGKNSRRLLETTHRSGGNPSRVLTSTDSPSRLLATGIAVFGNGGSLVVVPSRMGDARRAEVAEQEGTGEVW